MDAFTRSLWWILGSSAGGPTRVRVVMALHDRPRNAFQLCKDLALDYSTVQHHLRILTENHLVDGAGPRYGRVYVPSQSLEDHWKVMEEILERSERR